MSGDAKDRGRREQDRRAERLAAELRANLARRKAQARVRRDDETRGSETTDASTSPHDREDDT